MTVFLTLCWMAIAIQLKLIDGGILTVGPASDVAAGVGDTITLTCTSSETSDKVLWLQNVPKLGWKKVDSKEVCQKCTVEPPQGTAASANLTIPRLTFPNAGLYTCRVQGQPTTDQSVNVVVVGLDVARVGASSKSQEVAFGDSALFRCKPKSASSKALQLTTTMTVNGVDLVVEETKEHPAEANVFTSELTALYTTIGQTIGPFVVTCSISISSLSYTQTKDSQQFTLQYMPGQVFMDASPIASKLLDAGHTFGITCTFVYSTATVTNTPILTLNIGNSVITTGISDDAISGQENLSKMQLSYSYTAAETDDGKYVKCVVNVNNVFFAQSSASRLYIQTTSCQQSYVMYINSNQGGGIQQTGIFNAWMDCEVACSKAKLTCTGFDYVTRDIGNECHLHSTFKGYPTQKTDVPTWHYEKAKCTNTPTYDYCVPNYTGKSGQFPSTIFNNPTFSGCQMACTNNFGCKGFHFNLKRDQCSHNLVYNPKQPLTQTSQEVLYFEKDQSLHCPPDPYLKADAPCANDKNTGCVNWAETDQCLLNPSYMYHNCYKACTKCTPQK